MVSTGSMPPILLISGPHRATSDAISRRCTAGSLCTTGMRSTMDATTASRTLRRSTLLAMRSVLSSTAAFSTEWPSANARSSDCVTSALNSCSAAAVESAWIDSAPLGAAPLPCETEEREEVRESAGKEELSLSSSSSDESEKSVWAFESRSAAVSPV